MPATPPAAPVRPVGGDVVKVAMAKPAAAALPPRVAAPVPKPAAAPVPVVATPQSRPVPAVPGKPASAPAQAPSAGVPVAAEVKKPASTPSTVDLRKPVSVAVNPTIDQSKLTASKVKEDSHETAASANSGEVAA